MKKRFRLLLALCASAMLSVACSTKPAAPEKPVPVIQVTTVQAEPVAVPKAEIPKPAVPESLPEKQPETNVPAPAPEKVKPAIPPAKTETPAPEKNPDPEKAEAPQPHPEPAVVEKEPLPPPAKTITLRCAYWDKPAQNTFDVYVRQNGKFQRCQLFELVFSQKLTPELEKDGKITVYRKIDDEFSPIFSIEPNGMDNLAVVILPKFDPNAPDGAYVQLFDLDEDKFPKGTLKIVNWSKDDIDGDIAFRAANKKQRFILKCGEFFVSEPLEKKRDICNISFFDTQKPDLPLYESAFSLFKENQTILFVLKNKTTGAFEFKMSKIR